MQKMRNVLKLIYVQLCDFLVFEIWSVLFSKFVLKWDLDALWTWLRNANQWYPITSWLGGFNPKAVVAWEQSPRWGCGVRSPPNNIFFPKFVSVPNSLRDLGTKSTKSQKLKSAQLSRVNLNPFQDIAHPLGQKVFFVHFLKLCTKNFERSNSKTKNRKNQKIDFSFVSAHSASLAHKRC